MCRRQLFYLNAAIVPGDDCDDGGGAARHAMWVPRAARSGEDDARARRGRPRNVLTDVVDGYSLSWSKRQP